MYVYCHLNIALFSAESLQFLQTYPIGIVLKEAKHYRVTQRSSDNLPPGLMKHNMYTATECV